MKSNSHSLGREAECSERLSAQSEVSHFRTMCLPSNSSGNPTPHKFGVVNLVAQHDEAAYQKFSGDGYFRLGLITTAQQAFVKLLELRVFAGRRLASFVEQKRNKREPCLLMLPIRRRSED